MTTCIIHVHWQMKGQNVTIQFKYTVNKYNIMNVCVWKQQKKTAKYYIKDTGAGVCSKFPTGLVMIKHDGSNPVAGFCHKLKNMYKCYFNCVNLFCVRVQDSDDDTKFYPTFSRQCEKLKAIASPLTCLLLAWSISALSLSLLSCCSKLWDWSELFLINWSVWDLVDKMSWWRQMHLINSGLS